jgi:ElaB/YqjD/DUF883 family membrane-anchored ribosome-binding protein
MAQETSGLKRDDERTEVHSDLDRDAGLSTTSITDANAYDDDTRLTLSTDDDETTTESETAEQTEQLRQEIEETRASMGSTIDAIQERLSIQNISEQVSEQVNSAIESAKESVYEATIGKVANLMKETGKSLSSSNIGRTISSNPWPYALIGLGSAWLIYDSMSGSGSRRRRFSGNGGTRFGERNYLRSQEQGGGYAGGQQRTGEQSGMLSNATESVSNVAGSAYASVSSTASNAVNTVSNTASETYNKAADVAGRAYERVGEYGHVAQEKYEEYIETKPLAVAAAAAAVGAAIGLAIPSTRYEGELVGETRDQLMSRAGDAATQLVDRAKEVAGEAGAVIKDELQSATETTGSTGTPGRSTGGSSFTGTSTTGTGRTGTGGGGGV